MSQERIDRAKRALTEAELALERGCSAEESTGLVELLESARGELKAAEAEHAENQEKNYILYYDDSSSDEESEKVAAYNILDSYGSYKESGKEVFLLHAVGLQVFNSKEVRTQYMRIRQDSLSLHAESVLNNYQIDKWVRNAIRSSIRQVLKIPHNKILSQQIIKSFLEKEDENINRFIEYINSNKRLFFKSISLGQHRQDALKSVIEYYLKGLEDRLSSHCNVLTIDPQSFTLQGTSATRSSIQRRVDIHINAIIQERIELVRQNDVNPFGFLRGIDDRRVSGALKVGNPNEVEKTIFSAIYYDGLKVRGGRHIDTLKGIIEKDFSMIRWRRLLIRFLTQETSTQAITEYLRDSLKKEKIHTIVCEELIRTRPQIERPILDSSYTFEPHNIEGDFRTNFLATLALSSRSAKRHIRNILDNQPFRLEVEESSARCWRFPSSDKLVVDMQTVTGGARKDRTMSLSTYETIGEYIKKIQEDLSITDSEIVQYIRLILSGNVITLEHENKALVKEIQRTITRITYLIFGSEVVRNPASLICNQMMLDLIQHENEEWSWELAFTGKPNYKDKADGGDMPMSMKEAVQSARALNKRFASKLPCFYWYEGPESGRAEELFNRELIVFSHWKKYIHPGVKNVQKTIESILEACERWYGVSISLSGQVRQTFVEQVVGREDITDQDSVSGLAPTATAVTVQLSLVDDAPQSPFSIISPQTEVKEEVSADVCHAVHGEVVVISGSPAISESITTSVGSCSSGSSSALAFCSIIYDNPFYNYHRIAEVFKRSKELGGRNLVTLVSNISSDKEIGEQLVTELEVNGIDNTLYMLMNKEEAMIVASRDEAHIELTDSIIEKPQHKTYAENVGTDGANLKLYLDTIIGRVNLFIEALNLGIESIGSLIYKAQKLINEVLDRPVEGDKEVILTTLLLDLVDVVNTQGPQIFIGFPRAPHDWPHGFGGGYGGSDDDKYPENGNGYGFGGAAVGAALESIGVNESSSNETLIGLSGGEIE